jgi:2-methylcitrate dehydratase PrpD
LELVHTHNLKSEDISTVTLNVTPIAYQSFVGQQFEIGDMPQANAAFSLRYTVANALLRRGVRLEHFTEELIRDPKVVGLAKNMKLVGDMPGEKLFATHLEVKTKDGKRFSVHMDNPKGDGIPNPLSGEEIKDKFRTNVSFSGVVAKESAEKALDMLERLDEVEDVKRIVHLIVSRN